MMILSEAAPVAVRADMIEQIKAMGNMAGEWYVVACLSDASDLTLAGPYQDREMAIESLKEYGDMMNGGDEI